MRHFPLQTVHPPAATYNASVLQPLKTLLTTIHQNPDIARCLLERLHAWVAATVPALRLRAQGLGASSDLTSLRQAFDLFRFSQLVQSECLVPDDATLTGITSSDSSLLDRAVRAHDWATAALWARELILASADSTGPAQRFAGDLHALLQTQLTPADKLDAARVAYALGDDADARATAPSGAHAEALRSLALVAVVKKHKKRKKVVKPAPTRTPTPTPRPTSTPTATATPKPVTLAATLASGVAQIRTQSTAGTAPTFSWQPVPGAAKYVVILSGGTPAHLPWAWSGTSTSVQYGDTSLSGVAGSETEAWPIPVPASAYTWSVLALDGGNHIIGVGLRLPI